MNAQENKLSKKWIGMAAVLLSVATANAALFFSDNFNGDDNATSVNENLAIRQSGTLSSKYYAKTTGTLEGYQILGGTLYKQNGVAGGQFFLSTTQANAGRGNMLDLYRVLAGKKYSIEASLSTSATSATPGESIALYFSDAANSNGSEFKISQFKGSGTVQLDTEDTVKAYNAATSVGVTNTVKLVVDETGGSANATYEFFVNWVSKHTGTISFETNERHLWFYTSTGATASMNDLSINLIPASFTPNYNLPKYNLMKMGEVLPQGWIREQMRLDLREGLVGAYPRVSDNVNQNLFAMQDRQPGTRVSGNRGTQEKAWWAGEHEGYWADAWLRMAILTVDEEYLSLTRAWVERILTKAQESGYVGIYDETTRLPVKGFDGELWTQSRVFQALLAWYEFTGDQRVLSAVEKTVRQTVDHYRQFTYFGRPVQDGGVTHAVGYMDTLEWLFRLTTDRYYADAAVWLYEDYARNTHRAFYELSASEMVDVSKLWYYHTPHVAEALHMPGIAAYFSGNPYYGKAAENIPLKLARHTNPGGGFVAGKTEVIDGALGGGDVKGEYCSVTEGVQVLNRRMVYENDLFCGHWNEKATLNAGQGARFHPANTAVIYLANDNRLNADDRNINGGRELFSASHRAAACCTLTSLRLMPYYVEGMWLKKTAEPGLLANLYGASMLTTEIGGIDVRIEQKTDYPFSDQVVFLIDPSGPVKFELMLRVPPNSGTVTVNAGEKAEVQRDGDAIHISKVWNSGDRVAVDFDFQIVRKVPQDKKGFYYQWGPLVFALPFKVEKTVIEEIASNSGGPSGFNEYSLRAASSDGWAYRVDPNAEFELVSLPGSSQLHPWAQPPIGLKGRMLNTNGAPVEVTLVPLGSTLLRRTTFPLEGSNEDTGSQSEYIGTGGIDDPMRFF